jgi:hypothetical protein
MGDGQSGVRGTEDNFPQSVLEIGGEQACVHSGDAQGSCVGFGSDFSLGFIGFAGELGIAFLVAEEPNRHGSLALFSQCQVDNLFVSSFFCSKFSLNRYYQIWDVLPPFRNIRCFSFVK